MNARMDLHLCQLNRLGLYYRTIITEPIVFAFALRQGACCAVQDANVKNHLAEVPQDHLQMCNINTLTLPSSFTTFSLLIMCRTPLTSVPGGMGGQVKPFQQVVHDLLNERLQIQQKVIHLLFWSMRHRCNACFQPQG